jgi:hypothetical protein
MRTFIAKSGQTLQQIGAELVDGRVGKAQAEAALRHIQALNPGIGTGKLKEGTVVIVPAGRGLKTGPTRAVKQDPAESLAAEFERAAGATRKALASALEMLRPERDELSEALRSEIFSRALKVDKDLAGKVELARKSMAIEEAEDKQLLDAFEGLVGDARAALEKLDGMLG